jgi:hypothetical protein
MKPIEVRIVGVVRRSPQEICAEILDTSRWPEFTGYAFLPGIEEAHFEIQTPEVIGSRIKVRNTDGSTHIEEIVEWNLPSRLALKFQTFESPVKHLATHFLEVWTFRETAGGTEVTRSMTMYPKGIAGWLMLIPISKLMKKAFEKNLNQTSTSQ